MTDDEQTFCTALCARSATIARAQRLAQRFLQLVRERQAERLAPWLVDARASGIAEFVSFAKGLQRDQAAVYAALATGWSNGATEGNINRLKLIRRSMYGRGSFELLRRRVLHAS